MNSGGRKAEDAERAAGSAIFGIDALRRAAGDKVFARGVDYQERGLVEIFSLGAARVRARVIGSEPYMVDLAVDGADLVGECTCPAHRDFGFCKHMVAAALAANDASARGEGEGGDGYGAIRTYLDALDREALKTLVIDFAESDPEIARKLALRAAMSGGDANAIAKRLRREIDAATKISGYVEYSDATAWASRVEDAIEAIDGLLASGAGDIALPLVDRLADRLKAASERIDDSDGCIGDLLHEAVRLHLTACRIAKPDPLVLARDLLARELDGDLGFERCFETYADVLGAEGQSEIGCLAAKAWAEIPPAKRAKRDSYDDGYFLRERLASILDLVAENAGDLGARIAIRSKHLARPMDYLGLAKFCAEHGKAAEAVKWMEEALFVFEDEPDERLAVCAAELFRQDERADDAQTVLWRAFAARPSESLFQNIVAGAKGAKRRELTDRALVTLKSAATSSNNTSYGHRGAASDLAVSILMSEKRFGDAWDIAKTIGCPAHRLEQLARACETSHPQEAGSVYRLRIDAALAQGGDRAYREAKELILRLRAIAERTDGDAAQAAYETALVAQHRAKRNFIKLLKETSGSREQDRA